MICDLLCLFICLLMQVAKYTTRCKNISHGCRSWLNSSFEVAIIVATPLQMAPFKTIYLNVIGNDNINKKWELSFMDNTMSTCQEIWRKGEGVQKNVFIHNKCKIQHFRWWKQRHLEQHHEKLCVPLHGNTIKDVLVLKEYLLTVIVS